MLMKLFHIQTKYNCKIVFFEPSILSISTEKILADMRKEAKFIEMIGRLPLAADENSS
jgi:hypothetical protein